MTTTAFKSSSNLRTKISLIACAVATCAASCFGQATYTFNASSGNAGWGTSSTWTPTGLPGSGDTVVMVNAGGNLGIDGPQSASILNATSLTGNFTILSNVNGSTLSLGTLNKSGANGLTIRNNSASNTLSLDVSTVNLGGSGNLNIGSSASTNIASATIGTLNLNTSSASAGLFYYGADGQSFSIASADVTNGVIVLRNVSSGSTALSIASLTGSGGVIKASNSNAGSTGNLKLTKSSGTASYAGVLIDGVTGSQLNVEKTNAGTQTLTGTNTYSGATTVTGGTLMIAGSGAINNTSGITVGQGAAFNHSSSITNDRTITLNGAGAGSKATLTGGGAFSSALTLDNLGDTLAPGNGIGSQSFTTGQTWTSFSYDWELRNFSGSAAGTDFDQVAITGGLTLDGSAYQLNLQSLTLSGVSGNVGNFSETNQSWTILTTTGGITGFNASEWTLNLAGFSSSPAYSGNFSLGTVGNNLVLTYTVPEPSSILLFSLGALVTLQRLRSRRKH